MEKITDIDGILVSLEDPYMLGLGQQSQEDKDSMDKLVADLRERCKDIDFKVVLPDADYNGIERRAKQFIESSQLWDDRVLGAEEEFTEICTDPDVYRATRELARDRDESEREEFRRMARELRMAVMDVGNDVVVLGSGPRRVGGSVGALSTFAAMERQMLSDQIISIEDTEAFQHKPSFLDEKRSKLRKGRGHNKFKKGKKK